MSRSEGLEAKDPFLRDYKQSLQDVIKGMKKIGPSGLQLLVQEMIRSRWIKDRRASYPYEVAWVFDRREEAISGIMKKLEEGGDIEPAGLGRGKKGPVNPYKPRTLRLPKQTIKKPSKPRRKDV
ncbi:hypothetical protein AUI46_01525 [archaeon 13_1_40CM_2_52_13]|nr:MAG: hypothetical protein AUI46_01525 [archaeon 13_1_40CM_2_52_13]OLE68443.1 MAG: hypothetical protein AUF78_15920 [archaeon 13_1_20CM_2_51_12]TMI41411.1 MAG: hypothetical protein E6H21_03880 [Candidatus Bathyarchaeota archaeon]